LPDAGATYALLRAYGPALARSSALAVRTTIGFNFLGEFIASSGKGLFHIDGELPHGAIAPDFPRDHPLDVTAWIFEGRLHVQCAFLPDAGRSPAMERWIDQVVQFLSRVAGK
jgi:non-ribosomal peptide synthase protein (TIGR01720 family)